MTLTAPGAKDLPDEPAIKAWNLDASARRHHFEVALRRAYPAYRLAFFWVAELQRRGAIHYHGVVRGAAVLDQGRVRQCAVAAGFGFIAEVQGVREAAGAVGIWQYFAKYLFKSVKVWPYRMRPVACSRDWSAVRRKPLAGVKPGSAPQPKWALLPESAWWADEGRRVTAATLGADHPHHSLASDAVPGWVSEAPDYLADYDEWQRVGYGQGSLGV